MTGNAVATDWRVRYTLRMLRARWSLTLAATCAVTSFVLVGVSITITLIAFASPPDHPTPPLAQMFATQVRVHLGLAIVTLLYAAYLAKRLPTALAIVPADGARRAMSARFVFAILVAAVALGLVGSSSTLAVRSIRYGLQDGAASITRVPAFFGLGLNAALAANILTSLGIAMLPAGGAGIASRAPA